MRHFRLTTVSVMPGTELTVIGPGGERRWSHRQVVSMAEGQAVAVARLLDDLGRSTHATFETADAGYRASIPIDVVVEKAVIDPGDDDGSFRLLVPQGRTLCWNVKGVTRIRLTIGPEPDSVPADPSH